MIKHWWLWVVSLCPLFAYASVSSSELAERLSGHPLSWLCLFIFVLAYLAVMAEEKIHLSKSKPVILAAGIIWALIAFMSKGIGVSHEDMHRVVERNLGEYAAIFLFLLVAMTYVNTLAERNVFSALKGWLIKKRFTLKQIFWITGCLAFFISPVADNMTTALLMGAVIMAIGEDHPKFVVVAMINIVIASNAGGSFSPFGDITTLMVWQANKVSFFTFFDLFVPALVNFLIPALGMSLFLPNTTPEAKGVTVKVKPGGFIICLLFLLTIILAIIFEQILYLPAFMGMMTGLSLLMFFIYLLRLTASKEGCGRKNKELSIDIFGKIALAEWDTLLFFFGVIFSVGGLACLGFLTLTSDLMYGHLGPTTANIMAGIISSVVDNIPVMFAVLHMNPHMDSFQWLLITLTAGVGGSLLSIGSAAGVALMGISKGSYTFMSHLRWSWLILIGYGLSVETHFLLNGLK